MPNSFMYESGMIPEDDPDIITDKYLGKRAQFIKKYKEILWLRERHKSLKGFREKQKVICGK